MEERVSYALYGRVIGSAMAKSDTFVFLYEKKGSSFQLFRFGLPDDEGHFSFIVNPGTYQLACFEDRNNNHCHDHGEPTGGWGSPDEIIVSAGTKTEEQRRAVSNLDLEMMPGSFPITRVSTSIENIDRASKPVYIFGKRVDWDDSAFDDES